MRAGDLLRRIDRRLLPVLADAAVRLAQRPVRPQLLAGVAGVSISAVLVAAVWAVDHDDGAVRAVDDVVQVGVAEGESIPDYLRAVRGELATLPEGPAPAGSTGDNYALATFNGYLAPDRLAAVLSGVSAVEVYTRVPLGREKTQVIRMPAFQLPEDVLTGMEQVAERKSRQATDYRRRVAELGRAADLDQWLAYDKGARVATAEAAAYRDHCACVFAAVVQGVPVDLRRLARLAEIRVVDPAPEVRRLDRAVFLPPLPEYDEVVPVGDAALTSSGLPFDVPAAEPGGAADTKVGGGPTSVAPATDGDPDAGSAGRTSSAPDRESTPGSADSAPDADDGGRDGVDTSPVGPGNPAGRADPSPAGSGRPTPAPAGRSTNGPGRPAATAGTPSGCTPSPTGASPATGGPPVCPGHPTGESW
ncbi:MULTISPECIES: hypothetical protein [unclassified Solwaraspora]|uniref:hypothetical protein n=1 Tax=unclassified Solwaraspora TaxID=2627926 RepID=UPI00248D1C03|nr:MULTISPECIES: hypothetical protein [unclassified Solwaraspora]WBB94963.1 hypothetical protein O7553_16160 [Solwaraspora sp. WMMA2059]WBC21154.1 hypothetical protein O7543_01215 [Solwaraspora sp. WMMA2080]WJK36764.1 hypothetical protein O7610_10670 [Solwaraspora sp. WMMA2065]